MKMLHTDRVSFPRTVQFFTFQSDPGMFFAQEVRLVGKHRNQAANQTVTDDGDEEEKEEDDEEEKEEDDKEEDDGQA